LLYRVAK